MLPGCCPVAARLLPGCCPVAARLLPGCCPVAARLLEIWRGHWGIENRLHWVRDVVFGEDRSQVRTESAPQLLAALRNLVRTW